MRCRRLINNSVLFVFFFFFNDTATTEIYTLSRHDALPIFPGAAHDRQPVSQWRSRAARCLAAHGTEVMLVRAANSLRTSPLRGEVGFVAKRQIRVRAFSSSIDRNPSPGLLCNPTSPFGRGGAPFAAESSSFKFRIE